MRRTLILLVLVACATAAFPQVKFESLSFEQALSTAGQAGKMLFVQFESPSCDQCNEVADKAFDDAKLGNQLKEGFICIKIDAKHPDRNNIANLYDKENFFGTLFIAADGGLIHSFPKTTTMADAYIREIDQALTKAGEGLRLNQLEQQRNQNKNNIFFTEQLLLLRKSLYLDTDTLLDEYVSILPPDSLQSSSTLSFIAQQAPVLGGKADVFLRKNYPLFVKAWNTLPLSVRIGINNRIIYKSMRNAVRGKNLEYAYKVASFARNVHNENVQAGMKAYDASILSYYRQTNDTMNYLVRVVNYYDNYYMTVSVDSVKKRDSLNRAALLAKQEGEKIIRGDSVVYKKTISYAPITQVFSRELNNGAWVVYTWTNDPLYLKKALQWAARANEFFDSPEAADSYARLLYKTGNKTEAIQQESRAIDLRKKRGYKTDELEKVLTEMQKGKSLTNI
jgi:Thioredoxin-like